MAQFVLAILLLCGAPAGAEELTKAGQALLIDIEADAVLFAKAPDAPFPPASLAKLMTMVVVFDEVRAGRLPLDERLTISEYAWRHGGAPSRTWSMFAAVRSQVAVADLIRGVVVQAGNDAAIVLAERIAGTEAGFAKLMNDRAKQLGMTRSAFKNPTGLPEPGQRTTARDLSILARALIEQYADFYPIYREPEFTWNRVRQLNRNPLLRAVPGSDGLAVGFTEGAGYSLVGSVVRDGRRLLLVLAGVQKDKEREEDARKLFDWGFSAFIARPLFALGQPVAEARVFGGTQGSVALIAERPIALLAPKGDDAPIVAKVVYDGPLEAPIDKGAAVGTLRVWRGPTLTLQVPLRTSVAVPRGGLASRAFDGAAEIVRNGFSALMARI